MNFPKIGFAKRLLVLYGITFILVLLVTDWTLSHVLQKRDLQNLRDNLFRQASLIRKISTPLLLNSTPLQTKIKTLAQGTDLRITIVDPQGTVVADSSEPDEVISKMDNHATRPEIAVALRNETGASSRYSTTLKTKMLYLAVPIVENGKVIGAVRTAMPVTRVDEILSSIRGPVIATAFLSILTVLIAGTLFSHRLTKRIGRITEGAERYARENWSEKILIDGKDELKMLANTMNQMAASLRARIEDLESEKGKISAILANMTEGVIAIDPRKQFVTANPAAERFFGFLASHQTGKGLIEVTRHPQLEMLADRALRERNSISGDTEITNPFRKILHVNILIPEAQVRDIGAILVLHDMTELRRLENVRKEFVANVSHELRTPLTSIKGFIETLLGGASEDPIASKKFLKIIDEETARLGRLVEDILTLGEIEQGSALLKKGPLDLGVELPLIFERFKTRLDERQITIENRIPGSQFLLSGNRDKVQQVFVNLIDNAIKFNKHEKGRITLRAESGEKGVTVFVEDTGIGITEEARERIFERFFREDKTRSKELGGTGLGLAIVKHIMEAHGGYATCHSTPGHGSTFSVFFPR